MIKPTNHKFHMDPEERGSGCEDMNRSPPKSCTDCHTTRTPLWRGGPAGPKSLCNACGIRYRKKRSRLLGLDKGGADQKKKNSSSSTGKLRLHGLRREMEMVLQRSLGCEKKRKKLGEEEEAAILLMALSCGSVYS